MDGTESHPAMHTVHDSPEVVAASLAPDTLNQFEPVLRRLLAGVQHFVRQADGRYRPSGCSLGLGRCFERSELVLAPHD